MRCIRYLSTILCFLQAVYGQAALKFDHITNRDGLSESSVYDIVQDSIGFMWFATHDGLNKYDGYTLTVYQHDPLDSTSISHSDITCMFVDSKGNLWIGTNGGGLNLYDYFHDRFIRFVHNARDSNTIADNSLWDIEEDDRGGLWLATQNGLDNFIPGDVPEFIHYGFNPNDENSISSSVVFSVLPDDVGGLWIGTLNGLDYFDYNRKLILHYKPDPKNSNSLSHSSVFSLCEDRYGQLWVGTLGGGLNLYNKQTNQFIRYQNAISRPNSLSNDFIWKIAEDSKGNLWIGTDMGLNLYRRETDSYIQFYHDPDDKSTLSNNIIKSIFEDRNGRLWVGCQVGGVNIYDPFTHQFVHYRYIKRNSNNLSHHNVTAVAEDRQGNLWLATDGGGLNCFNSRSEQFIHFKHDPTRRTSIANNKLLTLCIDTKDNVWIGMWNGGADYYDRESGQFIHFRQKEDDDSSLSSDNISYIFEDSRKRIWIATWTEGLNLLVDAAGKKFKRYKSDPDNKFSLSGGQTSYIFEDSDHNIWVATSIGINRFDEKSQRFFRFMHIADDASSLSDNHVNFIYEDSKKRLWIGTSRGLNLFDSESERFIHFQKNDGFPSLMFHGMLEDDSGYLWISTNKGITKFDPDKCTCKNYDVRDGLQSDQFNSRSCVKTRQGVLVFGGINGFNIFHPDSLKENHNPPPVVLTNLQISNERVPVAVPGSPLEKHISQIDRLVLTHRQSPFKLEFAALNYTVPEKNCYRYKLTGFDELWNDIGTIRNVTFMNLDPGNYSLLIKACNNDGIWNLKPISLEITILPPFWHSWWFRLGIVLSLFSLIILLYKLRIRSIRRRYALLDQLVKKRTVQLETVNKELEAFAYSVSHDLRAPLRSITGFSYALAEENQSRLNEQSLNFIERIKSASVQMAQIIDDLLKLSRISLSEIQYNEVDLSQLTKNIVNEMREKDADLIHRFEIQPGVVVGGDVRLLRIAMSNLIGNAVKFSSKTKTPRIEFGEVNHADARRMQVKHRRIFFLRDNGAGFDMQFVNKLFDPFQRLHSLSEFDGTGIGLAIVKRIIDKHGGSIWARGEVDKGAVFYFTLS